MKLLICGSRDYKNQKKVHDILNKILVEYPDFIIIHGDCPTGTDHFARCFAEAKMVPERKKRYPANWNDYPPQRRRCAGPIRNQKMLDMENPDVVLAIGTGGKGTTNMLKLAREYKKNHHKLIIKEID